MFLCIKNLAGGLFYINNVSPSTTILDIKQRLSQLCETCEDIILQRLSLIEEQGNFILLNNDQTLEHYDIKDEQQICLYIEEFFYMPSASHFLEMAKLYKCNTQPLLERLNLTVGKIYPFILNDMNYIHRRQAYSDEYHTFTEATTPQVCIGIYETYKTYTHVLPLHCHISGQVQSIELFVIGQDTNGDPIPVGGYIKLIQPIECYTEDGNPYHIDAIHSPAFESIILYLQCIDEVIN